MRNRTPSRTLAALAVAGLVSGCVEPPAGESAETEPSGAPTASVEGPPVMTVNQLMRGILFPLGNAVFLAQSEDPDALPRDPMPSASPNPLTGLFGGWEAVENSALALAESADLLLIPGRVCSNGEVVDVAADDWLRFVADYRETSLAAYEAARTKNQDALVDASGTLSEACLACHRVYRRGDLGSTDTSQRCIPGTGAPR